MPGHVSKGWLLRQLDRHAPTTPAALAYVTVLEQLTGQAYVLRAGRWLQSGSPAEECNFADRLSSVTSHG